MLGSVISWVPWLNRKGMSWLILIIQRPRPDVHYSKLLNILNKMARFFNLFQIKIFFRTTAVWTNWEKYIQVPRRYILRLSLRAPKILTRSSMALTALHKSQPRLGQRWQVQHYSKGPLVPDGCWYPWWYHWDASLESCGRGQLLKIDVQPLLKIK